MHPSPDFRCHDDNIHGETGKIKLDGDGSVSDRPIFRIVRGTEIEALNLRPGNLSIRLAIENLVSSIETGASYPLSGQNDRWK